ncbi:MAG TPA: hypothetical protein VH701_25435 [Vicinamibacterales bacterium]
MRRCSARGRVLVLGLGLVLTCATGASAQANDPNPGNLTVTAGLDFPTEYMFRGILQEVDPKLTMWPFVDLGYALFSGDGGVKSVGVNVGLWNSLHTGSSGSDGPGELWYEEDFYAGFTLGFGGGTSLATTYTAYTSPNNVFRNVKEISFKVSVAQRFAPYALFAFELGDTDSAGADGGDPGTYLELGIGPSWPLAGGKATVAIPVKLGMSLGDYYQGPDGDSTFGFFDIGALLTIPLGGQPSSFGSWNFHAGIDFFALGDTTKFFNEDNGNKIVGLVGLGLSY